MILCAIPANTEFVTSAAVKLASSADPQGLRTLGVVTKVDQVSGSIKKKLEGLDGSDVKLKLGFVAVGGHLGCFYILWMCSSIMSDYALTQSSFL